jgi:PncC family amidohydrolase
MMNLCCDVISRLQGKTLVTAESLTGGGIGNALTAVSGSSAVYKGGVISYTNAVKESILGVPDDVLERYGAVSQWTAGYMASGVRRLLQADIAVSVTGLAGPGSDDYGNPVGTVYIGYADEKGTEAICFHFDGDREAVRTQAAEAALELILSKNK